MFGASPGPLQAGWVEAARGLVARLAVLAESEMRGAALAEQLGRMGAVQAVWTLETLIRGALFKEEPALALYGSLVDPRRLAAELPAARLDDMLQAGLAEGCVAAVQWLLSPRAEPSGAPAAGEALVDKELRELTLGGRRALARRAVGETINRLAGDPDPGVIGNLLNNPRVGEATVVAISSRRPTVSAALEAVLASRRWARRYRVKLALVKNPYLSQPLAVNLLPLLRRPDLEGVRDDESLAPALRLAAQRLIDLTPP